MPHTDPSEKDLRSTGEHPVVHIQTMTDAERAEAWRAVARNISQVLLNTLHWIDEGRACGFSAKALVIDTALLRGTPDRIAEAHHVQL